MPAPASQTDLATHPAHVSAAAELTHTVARNGIEWAELNEQRALVDRIIHQASRGEAVTLDGAEVETLDGLTNVLSWLVSLGKEATAKAQTGN